MSQPLSTATEGPSDARKTYPKAIKQSQKKPKEPKPESTGTGSNSSEQAINVKSSGSGGSIYGGSAGGGQTSSAAGGLRLRLDIFDHLDRNKPSVVSLEGNEREKNLFIHPAAVKLGQLYRKGVVREDGDRVAALVVALRNIIKDYSTPPNMQMKRDLDKHIRNQIKYLFEARQYSMGMGNIVKYIRHLINGLSADLSEADAKTKLLNDIDAFVRNRLVLARESIAIECETMFRNGDVILTFGSSCVVREVNECHHLICVPYISKSCPFLF